MKILISELHASSSQLLKFLGTGILNTCISYVVFLLLYRETGLYYLYASAIGYTAGLTNSFLINRRWTFESHGKVFPELMKFILVNLFAMSVNLLALKLSVQIVGFRPEIGQVGAFVFSTVANFAGNKFWTFR